MNNNMNFDPMTGLPLNQGNNTPVPEQPQNINVRPTVTPMPTEPQVQPTQIVKQEQPINANNIQQQMQSIPTVEQSKTEFITNTQASNIAKKEEKKDGPNYVFIAILFIIIFASIFFLFPYLLKTL